MSAIRLKRLSTSVHVFFSFFIRIVIVVLVDDNRSAESGQLAGRWQAQVGNDDQGQSALLPGLEGELPRPIPAGTYLRSFVINISHFLLWFIGIPVAPPRSLTWPGDLQIKRGVVVVAK